MNSTCLFVMEVWMTEGPRVNFEMREALFKIYTWIPIFHTSMRNKQVELNPYIHTLSKLSRFGYEISIFKYTKGRYSEEPPEQPTHTSWQRFHGKMDVKMFLMFIEAENTGSVNISSKGCSPVINWHHMPLWVWTRSKSMTLSFCKILTLLPPGTSVFHKQILLSIHSQKT